tara:strand:+ start:514 stop:648 length:135 start_codon:yes stop_codon:yes gene_type:complete
VVVEVLLNTDQGELLLLLVDQVVVEVHLNQDLLLILEEQEIHLQ